MVNILKADWSNFELSTFSFATFRQTSSIHYFSTRFNVEGVKNCSYTLMLGNIYNVQKAKLNSEWNK